MIKFELQGLDVLDKSIKKLETKIQRRVIAKALRAGARVVQRKAKSLAPRGRTGKLIKEIKVVTLKSREPGTGLVAVTTGKAFYAHFLEFGVEPHAVGKGSVRVQTRTGRAGQQRGKKHPGIKKKPFLRPAFDETQKEQLDAIGNVLANEIIKETEKL